MKKIELTWTEIFDLGRVITEVIIPMHKMRITNAVGIGVFYHREFRVKVESAKVTIKLLTEAESGNGILKEKKKADTT